ncbi:MAG: ribonuclease H-like YkuK family protein [Cohnella sp.]|nr:ribonuclease H-like YkuK family protein [Cohnella sp.]
MTMLHSLSALERVTFQNQTERKLGLDDVRERIVRYVADAPEEQYHFIIGTDSQGHRGYTKFATGVVLHRLGQGAWACYRQFVFPRQLTTIREKLMLETILSLEVARRFDPDDLRSGRISIAPYDTPRASVSLSAYIDIDAGTVPQVNKTAECVREMVELVTVTGNYEPRVKPYAYAASSYANRHTKK